jgi:transposase InsO family protein
VAISHHLHLEVLRRPLDSAQYTSWAFGRRLRSAGLLGSMGSIGDCYDNSVAESFFGTLQLELLDEHRWDTREQLAVARQEHGTAVR